MQIEWAIGNILWESQLPVMIFPEVFNDFCKYIANITIGNGENTLLISEDWHTLLQLNDYNGLQI